MSNTTDKKQSIQDLQNSLPNDPIEREKELFRRLGLVKQYPIAQDEETSAPNKNHNGANAT